MAKFKLTVTGDSIADCVAAVLASLTDEEVLTDLRKRMAEKGNVVTVALDPIWAHAAEEEARTGAWAKAEAAHRKAQAAKLTRLRSAKAAKAKAKGKPLGVAAQLAAKRGRKPAQAGGNGKVVVLKAA